MSTVPSSCAWVESPLQLLCVVEYAAATGTSVRVVPRVGALQLAATIARLRTLGLPDGVTFTEPRSLPFDGFLGPSSRHWILGDAFSGVARSAIALRMPQRLTLVDDGSASLALPDVLAGSSRLSRSSDPAPIAPISELASSRVRALDAGGDLELFSYYELDHPAHIPNRFRWLRSRGIQAHVAPTIVLGSAAVVDRLMGEQDYLDWVAAQQTPAGYFPHRRESPEMLERVAALPGITVQSTGLPIELVLAGSRSLQIASLPSSAVDTLEVILAGSGSTFSVMRSVSAGRAAA